MIPKYLRMKNFLSHNASEIDFASFKVALILGTYDNELDQSNGSGKCLYKNTILTNAFSGERITIEELYNSKKDFFVLHHLQLCQIYNHHSFQKCQL